METRAERERRFHDLRFADGVGARPQDNFYRAVRDAESLHRELIESLIVPGASVLEIGCSTGGNLKRLLGTCGFHAHGIDISGRAIEAAEAHTRDLPHAPRFYVMDANALAFPDGMFDLCFGSGVIHHLRLPEALGEIRRVLKIGGTMIFLEPLATNAVIELYRRLTPKDRTADETPLTAAHLDELRRRFRDVKLEYFGFFTLSEMALAKWPRIQDFLHMIARRLDRILFRVPGGWRLAWVVVIVART